MTIKPVLLSAENFKNYGEVLTDYGDIPMADDSVITYFGKIAKIDFSDTVSTGFLIGHKRKYTTDKLERHIRTPELLVCLKSDSLILAGLPDADGDGVKDVRAFYIKQGQAVVFHKATWHWTPFPISEESCEFLVVFNDKTESKDLEIKTLGENIEIEGIFTV